MGICVSLVSYADDVNPLITTSNRSRNEHRRIVAEVNNILEEVADVDELKWDPSMESGIEFGCKGETITLGIHLNAEMNFQPHVNARTKKAEQLLKVMLRLGNSDGAMSHQQCGPRCRSNYASVHLGRGALECPTYIYEHVSNGNGGVSAPPQDRLGILRQYRILSIQAYCP